MIDSVVSKTGLLSRLIIRRDRFRIPVWLVGLTFFTLIVPIAFVGLYSSQAERDAMAETMANPAMIAMVGPADLGNYTMGVMTSHQMLLLTAVVVGLMSVLLVTRHTRADEEDGRIELIRSLPVGRLSNLNASILVVAVTNLVLALIVGFGLFALNIESINLEGSLLYGAALGGTGILFACLTALLAQLSESSRGTIGLSIAVLLTAYLIRAIGDVSNDTISWISPLNWVTRTEAYSSNNWWPVVLIVSLSMILWIAANYLNAVRDLGAGLLPSKPGKKYASLLLQSPIGLALRLQRTGIIAWAVGMLLMGLSYGSVLGDMESFFEGNEMMEQLLAQNEGYTITEQFIPMLMVVMALLSTVPPVMAMNKLYGEEKKNRIEHLLGRAVSRTRLMASYLAISMINGFVMVSLAGIGLWAAGTAVMEEPFGFGMVYGGAVAYYPAMLLMISITVLLIGFLPKLVSLIWFYIFYSFIVLYLGGLFQFPEWVSKLSPFGYIPQLPIDDMNYTSIVMLSIIAVVLTVIGFIGYNKRDIEA